MTSHTVAVFDEDLKVPASVIQNNIEFKFERRKTDVVFLFAERFQTILVSRFMFYIKYSPNLSLSLSTSVVVKALK